MSEQEHIEDNIAASALGALSRDEQAQVEQHTATCPACRHLLAEAHDTVHMLAFAARPVALPEHTQARIMAAIEREQFLEQPTRLHRPFPLWTAWVATGIALLLIMWNIKLQRDNSMLRLENTVIAADPQPRLLKPHAGSVSTAEARIYMGSDGSMAMLVVKNLDPAPSGKVYQIWLANDETKQPIQTFQSSHHVEQVMLRATESIKKYKWVMITIEDSSGSTVPSQQPVLSGDL